MDEVLRMGLAYLKSSIYREKERLQNLNDEISRLEKLKKTRAECAAIIAEYEAVLNEYERGISNEPQ